LALSGLFFEIDVVKDIYTSLAHFKAKNDQNVIEHFFTCELGIANLKT
jgi:hypothetical protein